MLDSGQRTTLSSGSRAAGPAVLRRGMIGVLCAAILSVSASPVWAAAPEPGPATAELGTLALGDGLEAVIGEADGSVRFGVAAGTLALGWDSRAIRTDRSGFGPGWGLPLASVGVRGGVQVFPASGGMFEVDDSHPSGLRGYPSADVRFQVAEPGAALDGRDGGPAVGYAYVLHETGGARTYFNAHGDPVARVTASDARTDWRWAEGDGHRLLAMVDPDGLATTIDWSDPSEVIVRPGANVTAPEAGSGAGGEWRIALDGGRVDRVVDPAGGSTRVGYDRAGRVAHLTTASGATTTLTWHEAPDGVARVAAVRTHDPAGTELSVREWEPVGGVGAVSGWPGVGDGSGPADDYSTVVTDGKTRVTSAFDDRQLMTGRAVSVATRSGERLVHEQSFGFPGSDEPVDPLRPVEPTEISVTSVDQAGARRTVQERMAYDELGRITRAADGSTYVWDAANRQVSQTTADGATIETAHWADGTRRQLADASGRTTFYWDGATLLNETHSAGGAASYLLGVNRHARTVERGDGTPETAYSATDRHGNVTEVTDAEGRVVTGYAYSDDGVQAVRAGSGGAAAAGVECNPFGYAGEYTHADGSQFLRVRTYDPALMTFTSRDTAQLHTVYGYANANPVMMVDPSGRDAVTDWVAVGLAGYAALAAAFGVLALATGGVSLGAFGVAGAVFGVADAAFTAVEAWSVVNDTTFMSDDVALGVGIGLAVVGTAFGIGGALKRANPDRWTIAFGTDAEVKAVQLEAARKRFEDTAMLHTGPVSGAGSAVPKPSADSPFGMILDQFRVRDGQPASPLLLAISTLETRIFGGRELDTTGYALQGQLLKAGREVLKAQRSIRSYVPTVVKARRDVLEWGADLGSRIVGLNAQLERISKHLGKAIDELKSAKDSPALPGRLPATKEDPEPPVPAYSLNELIAQLTNIDAAVKSLPRY
ncbi:RHS repeat domain-containing protein [Agromyces aerolatus]|uniref:RHS repeat domain-containing protein n=1 Tax=Agromyces sp. LY-1074 TaxID=3074080 RepID=UPI0028634E99|nr:MULTISPECIES: RHS repeat-associated core domain-containing protein [unclassified Agromyces]MDR5701001.1 RHS repeat-associated core domain-containing protein [Agromyces sp. LY-1074]MDR5707641.1 RHS repeat-associated core domain-containing protein [Agromyces sp. LY-1358]